MNPIYGERRAHKRYPINLKTRYAFTNSLNGLKSEGNIKDISHLGIKLNIKGNN